MFQKISLLSGVLVLSGFTVFNVFSHVGKVNAATPCVVTIFGKQYDVSPLQTTHSGGNVFVCGTDMTTTYQGMHGTDVTRILPYLIPPTPTVTPTLIPTIIPTVTPTTVPSTTPTITPVPSISPTSTPHQDDDEHEHENEHKDRENEKREHKSHRKNLASDQHNTER